MCLLCSLSAQIADMIQVQLLEPDDWQIFQETRLAALRDSPRAFGSEDYATAEQCTEPVLRELLDVNAMFAARRGGRIVGVAGVFIDNSKAERELRSLWVHPDDRRKGIGDLLVFAAKDWSTRTGCHHLRLWIPEGNHVAEQLCAEQEFVRTNERRETGDGGHEFQMLAHLHE